MKPITAIIKEKGGAITTPLNKGKDACYSKVKS